MTSFTLEEANRTLPLVRKIVEDIVREHRQWRERVLELDLVTSASRADAPNPRAAELERQVMELARQIDGFQQELESLGIALKDRRLGLVDFPSELDGRRVWLCWRLGEPSVQYWHELDEGYAGRRPVTPPSLPVQA